MTAERNLEQQGDPCSDLTFLDYQTCDNKANNNQQYQLWEVWEQVPKCDWSKEKTSQNPQPHTNWDHTWLVQWSMEWEKRLRLWKIEDFLGSQGTSAGFGDRWVRRGRSTRGRWR